MDFFFDQINVLLFFKIIKFLLYSLCLNLFLLNSNNVKKNKKDYLGSSWNIPKFSIGPNFEQKTIDYIHRTRRVWKTVKRYFKLRILRESRCGPFANRDNNKTNFTGCPSDSTRIKLLQRLYYESMRKIRKPPFVNKHFQIHFWGQKKYLNFDQIVNTKLQKNEILDKESNISLNSSQLRRNSILKWVFLMWINQKCKSI